MRKRINVYSYSRFPTNQNGTLDTGYTITFCRSIGLISEAQIIAVPECLKFLAACPATPVFSSILAGGALALHPDFLLARITIY